MTRALPALLCLLLFAAPALADPVDDLTALVREAAGTQNPTMAVMRGLARMGDFDLGQAQVRRALQKANLPPGGMLERILGPTTRLSKRGKNVQIDRSSSTTVAMETGHVIQLGRKVTASFQVHGSHDALIDKVSGIKVGESSSSLYDLWKIKFTRQSGKPVALITAGAFVFSKTVTIDLSKIPGAGGPVPGAAPPVTASAPHQATSAGLSAVVNETSE